ncbi:hypothetical protein CVS30_16290 [Arthrobacter psychrolactophilus]|uniref:N-acetyltransferase domain-containing protein n=1 Tax=Arthrobacter psychrolactophilus TaxID=92442 RepID=A0A2V5JDH6_9MICC|nr:N-acetyltransferase [Arthrobacter psychrolactophilus]PYI37277.1 hypothetical protein CVS30_16290 [Arthrobacter psychrolactophilus]
MDAKKKKQYLAVAPQSAADVSGVPAVALVHNLVLSQFEAYVSGLLAGYVRYSMRGAEMWLLHVHVANVGAVNDVPQKLIRLVLDDAGRRRIAVNPYCLEVRAFMRENPSYLQLVPQKWRGRFRLPDAVGSQATTVPGRRNHTRVLAGS